MTALNGKKRIGNLIAIAFMLISTMLIAACSGSGGSGSAERVFFVEPEDGATVANPVEFKMGAENFTIEPAGEIHDGAGHQHILVDVDCVTAGEVIPADDSHVHFGNAQTEAKLELAPGEHKLCLQAADGSHTALEGEGMTHEITITVE